MKTGHSPKPRKRKPRKRKCKCCGRMFTPQAHNANRCKGRNRVTPHQRHCTREFCQKAKLEQCVTAHTFRRSCATEMLRGNANIYHVKELLGHESLETLKHYAKLTITDLKATHAKCHPRERDGR